VIPDIDIWRATNLMLKRYGDKATTPKAIKVNVDGSGTTDGTSTLYSEGEVDHVRDKRVAPTTPVKTFQECSCLYAHP
jgi:hypothetical protein